ncbi:MAG: hypothetical protein JOZ62_16100, partial [Acidobacteriaceae bacterium]|nr:hypothetical protein [Acidobacteriaceae bacterium]
MHELSPLEFLRLRFEFIAREPVHFPAGQAGTLVRGALGCFLRKVGDSVQYARVFAPRACGGPSGFRDAPRPFVLRAAHLDGCSFSADAPFAFDIHLFDRSPSVVDAIKTAFAEIANEGLGPSRGKAELVSAEVSSYSIDLLPQADDPGAIQVEFVTPT